uniref:uncharacterized protein isoform X1 n=2 Tax=Semicossyphus pulcher TaxID=241346 RepID=UPI0037E74215
MSSTVKEKTGMTASNFLSWAWSIMRLPGGLLLLLLLQVFKGSTSGMLVTSCDSCHDEAACQESQETDNTFSSHVVSCVCKEGFVGDGQKCYDIKLCLNSSCCEEGYHWSAERGCVDTNECSLPDSPCKQHQVCQNTPGSFECLEPSRRTRSAPSSRSVQFSCGQSVCPSGMDCIRLNGNLRCADPCQNYDVLNDDWRSTNNTSTQNLHCDRNVNWQGWYRLFLWGKSAHIPERCVAENRCGTHAPLWITEPHPTRSDQIVSRTVCNAWSGSCCRFTSHDIHVKHCYGNYYVYKLVQPSVCHLAYCAEVNETAPIVSKTTLPPSTPATATNQVNIAATTTANNSLVAEGQVRLNGDSSRSVQFSCGQSVCPSGMDCIRFNGNLRCADPCQNYAVLNDDWRSTNNTSTQNLHCDRNVNWQGWYRLFLWGKSAHIPERCVAENRCGTHAPLWITEPHPTRSDQIENRTVCNAWSGSCCRFASHDIHVKHCYGNYYVYKLMQPSVCSLAYCAEVNETAPIVSKTTLPPSTPATATNQVNIAATTTANNSLVAEGQVRLNGDSSRSVQFSCGQSVCPSGMDCIRFNGNLRCADPCQNYTVLNDDWRSTNNTSTQNLHCDRNVNWQGWYRLFLWGNSAHIPERCVAENRCGTHAPLWITEPHPTRSDQIENRTVCNAWSGSCCRFTSHDIHVKHCYGNYYVYKLMQPNNCHLAYCAEVNETAPIVSKTTLPPSTPATATNQVNIAATTTANNSLVAEGQVRLNGDSSRSVQFSCGQSVCPSGMDCIRFNGNLRCADPCQNYTVLNDDWRSTNNTSTQNLHCDRNVNWQGWYRLFLWGNSAHIPERCVAENRCGTHAPLWITEPHPTRSDQIENRTVCNAWSGSCCRFTSHDIHVKHCYGNYYVYKLVQPSVCSLAYCAEVNETAPIVSTTTPPSTPPTATNQVNITATTTANNSSVAEGQVRLNGGNNSCSGRVEIFHRGQWGTVCDDSWGLLDSQVVCRQLGCGRVLSAPQAAAFGQGRGPIWMDDVSCRGSESELTECRHRGFGIHNCGHHEDASVVCEAASPVRLVNSNSRCSGRVEVYHNGQWGTVCDDGWDLRDANVVCRQLDCGPARSAQHIAAFGQGRGPIWMDNVSCFGNESSITSCRHQGFGVHNCAHVEDASVICEVRPEFSTTVPPTMPVTADITATTTANNSSVAEGQVRLNGGNNSCSGRLEIFHRGQWGTVCDDSWGLLDAQVVCRQLDCGPARSAQHSAAFGQGRGPIWMDDVSCRGNESELTECRHRGFGIHNCGHHEDASVVCEAASPVRLVNSNSRCSGRVEVYHNGQWGTVCDDSWDLRDADVVCRQLDCGPARSAQHSAAFGQGSGPIWMDDVSCRGSESELTECRHRGFGSHDCSHREDASVVCEVSPTLHHQLICGPDKLQVGLNLAGLTSSGLNPVSGNFAARNCSRVRVFNNMVWYEVDAMEGACGNMLMTNRTHAIYSNRLFIYPLNNGSFSLPVSIPFSCAYPLETDSSLNVAIRPFLPASDGISGLGTKARAFMALYRTSAYTETYPAGRVSLPVGSPLYVGVTVVGRDRRFVLVLENCYATSSPSPNDPMQYPLIRNKCPADSQQVSVIESGRSFRARFSALLFLLQGNYKDVFLHCNLSLCDTRNSCVPSCARRTYRSVSSYDVMEPLTIGPIVWDEPTE